MMYLQHYDSRWCIVNGISMRTVMVISLKKKVTNFTWNELFQLYKRFNSYEHNWWIYLQKIVWKVSLWKSSSIIRDRSTLTCNLNSLSYGRSFAMPFGRAIMVSLNFCRSEHVIKISWWVLTNCQRCLLVRYMRISDVISHLSSIGAQTHEPSIFIFSEF